MNAKQSSTCLGLALVAGAVGFAAGLLLAPASGPEIRRRLFRRIEDEKIAAERKGRRAVERLTDYVQDQVAEGKKQLGKVVTVS